MPLPGRKVRFLVDYSPHGRASVGPHYVKGQVYDLETSYAEKYKRIGKAEDAPADAAAGATTSVELDKAPALASVEAVEQVSEVVERMVEQTEQVQQNTHQQNRRGGRRG